MPGLLAILEIVFICAPVLWLALMDIPGVTAPYAHYLVTLVGTAAAIILVRSVEKLIPIQMLVCLNCKSVKVTRWTFEKGLPMDWQLDLSPSYLCTKCGYSLVALEEDRCPECGHPFPPAWRLPQEDLSAQSSEPQQHA